MVSNPAVVEAVIVVLKVPVPSVTPSSSANCTSPSVRKMTPYSRSGRPARVTLAVTVAVDVPSAAISNGSISILVVSATDGLTGGTVAGVDSTQVSAWSASSGGWFTQGVQT